MPIDEDHFVAAKSVGKTPLRPVSPSLASRVTYVRSKKSPKTVFIYDGRKQIPTPLNPVYLVKELQRKHMRLLIRCSDQLIVFRAASLKECLSYAAEHLPPLPTQA